MIGSDVEEGDALGRNVAVNGTFSVPGWWNCGAGWSIGGGTLNAVAVLGGSNTNQPAILMIGRRFRTTFTILNYVNGTVYIRCGNSAGIARSANGTYTEDILCLTTNNLFFWCVVGGTFGIDNVSVREIY